MHVDGCFLTNLNDITRLERYNQNYRGLQMYKNWVEEIRMQGIGKDLWYYSEREQFVHIFHKNHSSF